MSLSTIALDQINYKKRVELVMEGHRFYDLVGWNLGLKHLNHLTTDGYWLVFECRKRQYKD